MERHKATTRNGVPQGIGRLQYTSSQTDTVVRFASEHVVLFLYLCNLGRKGRHRLLHITTFLRGLEEHGIPPIKRYLIMFVRSTPCSSCVCAILSVRPSIKATTCNGVPWSGIVSYF